MSEAWLERGHGSKPEHLDVIFTSASRNRPLASSELADAVAATAGRTAVRSTRPLVVVVVWLGIILGTSGAAWAVRDALFPTIGPAEVSVWQNPGHDSKPHSDSEGDDETTSIPTPTVAVAPPTSTPDPTAVDDGGNEPQSPTSSLPDDHGNAGQGGPPVSVEAATTPTSVDDHGGGSGSGSGGGSGSHGGSSSGSSGSGSSGSGSSGSGDSGGSGGSGSGGGSDG